MKKLFLLIFTSVAITYFLTSAGSTPYNYFTRLASSFLQGKYYLTENPSWLSELIPAGNNRFFVVYPPMPAILLMPFVFFLKNFHQEWLVHLLGAGIAVLTMKLSLFITAFKNTPRFDRGDELNADMSSSFRRGNRGLKSAEDVIKNEKKLAVWAGFLAGFGTIIWFLSATGSSWYLGQVTAAFLLTAALVEALDKKRALWVGTLLGAAYLSRIHTIVSLPLFLYLLGNKNWFKNYLILGLGILPFVLFNFWYNFVRFGTILDKGYFLLPAMLNELKAPWFAKGVTNILYIPDNLRSAFWSFPIFLKTPPYIRPSWAGLAIWITTPAFIFAFFASLKERVVWFLWLAVLSIFLIVASHGGTGWAQFGYRFAVDFYPFLFFLTIKGVVKTGLKKIHWILLTFGILVNLWGVLWINKFGWVGF